MSERDDAAEGLSVVRLPSGLTLLHKEMPGQDLVAISAWVHVGSRHEDPVQAGISHDLEHLLSRGTKRRGELEDRLEIFSMGGVHGADTSYDRTTYHAVVPASGFAAALDALADSLQHPVFSEEGIQKERKVVGEEIARMVDRPEIASWRASWGLAFGRHPYGRPVIGDHANLAGLRREDFVTHHLRWYRPDNMVVVVAVPLSRDTVVAAVKQQFPASQDPQPPASGVQAPDATSSWTFRGFQRLRQVQDVPEP
jgi:zinc protease